MKEVATGKLISSDPPPRRVRNEINDQRNHHDNQNPEQEQQPMNDVEDGGNEYDQEEDEDYVVDDEDQSGEVEAREGEADGAENDGDEERPKLAEGFYEIEAVRKRRIRKGETQYLIKWRGWPESANTWEPVANLMSCADVIDAFEERLKSGKHRSNRKHKRKQAVASTSIYKKKQKKQPQQQESPEATYPIPPSTRIKIIEEPCEGHCIHKSNFSNMTENDVGGTSQNGTTNQSNSLTGFPQIGEKKARNEPDANHTDLKATSSTNQENMTEFAIHIQDDQAAEGAVPVEIKPKNGVSKVDETEVLRVSSRLGARRRKSCAVKRFKHESNSDSKNNISEKTTAASDEIVQPDDIQNAGDIGSSLDSKSNFDTIQNGSVITKIVKPVNYSTSILNGTEEVSVSFLVRRSDGEEVVVDNKYLKEINPILLINFYEQHLRYNSPE